MSSALFTAAVQARSVATMATRALDSTTQKTAVRRLTRIRDDAVRLAENIDKLTGEAQAAFYEANS